MKTNGTKPHHDSFQHVHDDRWENGGVPPDLIPGWTTIGAAVVVLGALLSGAVILFFNLAR